MAYFRQVKNYQLHLIQKCFYQRNICSPVLDVGCGTGDFLLSLQSKGLHGTGIDISSKAIDIAKNLKFTETAIKQQDLFETEGNFNFVLMIDVLEHIENDKEAMMKVSSLLNRGGYLILQVPSHSRKYCWIDRSYGHFRRYNRNDIVNLVKKAGLRLEELWCAGFPFISLMEELGSFIGEKILKKSAFQSHMANRTVQSGVTSPINEEIRFTNFLLNKLLGHNLLWMLPFWIMDLFLRTDLGSTYFAICKKT